MAFASGSTLAGAVTTTTTATSTATPNVNADVLSIAAFLFGFLVIVFVLEFLRRDRRESRSVLKGLASKGISVTVKSESDRGGIAGQEAVGESEIVIEGPSPLEVGKAAEFKATVGGVATVVTWSSSAPDVSGPVDGSDSRVSVTPTKSGQFTLKAESDGKEQSLLLPVIDKQPTSGTAQVPFLGAGWGAVVVLVTVSSITVVLGVTQVVSGETVGVILGTVVGYAAGSRSTSSNNETGASTTGTSGDTAGSTT